MEYSNNIDDIHKNIEGYNSNKKHKILKVFDDVIVDMLSNKKLNPIVTEFLIWGRKSNISVFITQHYFTFPKNIRLNSKHNFIMKISNKRQLQQIAFNHSFTRYWLWQLYESLWNCVLKNSFLVIDTTLPSDNPLRFRKNILERI